MTTITLVCTDGSELAGRAAAAGHRLLRDCDRTVVVTVVPEPHVVLPYDASGMAGAAVSADEITQMQEELIAEGQQVADATAAALGVDGVETRVIVGEPSRAICELAEELGASVIVLGTRGRGGLARAVMGSVSDHVIRHAPCPVLVTNPVD